MYELQVIDAASAASISDRQRADICEMADELLVDAGLKALGICSVNEEFAAVRLEEGDVFCESYVNLLESWFLVKS